MLPDQARFWAAWLVPVGTPVIFLYWMVIHPLAPWWRRVGMVSAFAAVVMVITAWVAAAVLFDVPHLLGERSVPPTWAEALGLLLLGGGVGIGILQRRAMDLRTLVGATELARQADGKLVTAGVYSRIRHPRYLQYLLLVAGVALLSGSATAWVFAAGYLPGILIVIGLEERELERRFGATYRAYRARTPMLLPRWGSVTRRVPRR